MKHADKAEQIVYLWLSFVDKNDKLDGIAGTGRTMMGAFSDFLGCIPKGSNFKPETIAVRAEKQQKIPITREERLARDAIMSLPFKSRLIVSIWPQIRKQENQMTGELYTKRDLLKALRVYGLRFATEKHFDESVQRVSGELIKRAESMGLKLGGSQCLLDY